MRNKSDCGTALISKVHRVLKPEVVPKGLILRDAIDDKEYLIIELVISV